MNLDWLKYWPKILSEFNTYLILKEKLDQMNEEVQQKDGEILALKNLLIEHLQENVAIKKALAEVETDERERMRRLEEQITQEIAGMIHRNYYLLPKKETAVSNQQRAAALAEGRILQ